jgi:hypothetical protein
MNNNMLWYAIGRNSKKYDAEKLKAKNIFSSLNLHTDNLIKIFQGDPDIFKEMMEEREQQINELSESKYKNQNMLAITRNKLEELKRSLENLYSLGVRRKGSKEGVYTNKYNYLTPEHLSRLISSYSNESNYQNQAYFIEGGKKKGQQYDRFKSKISSSFATEKKTMITYFSSREDPLFKFEIKRT